MPSKAIELWPFYEAAPELRIPYSGGDEDWLILIPPSVEYIPPPLERLGCCSNDWYRVCDDGKIEEREGTRGIDADGNQIMGWTATDWVYPKEYAGYTVIVATHA